MKPDGSGAARPTGPGQARSHNATTGPEIDHPALFEERREAWLREKRFPFQKKSYIVQLACFALLLVLWQLPVINPIKLLVVLFHEFWHVLLAYITGGVVFGVAIDPGGAGVTLGMGGNRLLIVAAGYVGSLAMGMCLYALSAAWKPGHVWLILTIFAALSLVMGWLNDFTKVFGIGALVAMGLGTVALSSGVKRMVLRFVGTACCLYPIIDVAGELLYAGGDGFRLHGAVVGSDVLAFSSLVGVPWVVAASFWCLAGLALLAWLVTWSARKEATGELQEQLVLRARARDTRKRMLDNLGDPRANKQHTIK